MNGSIQERRKGWQAGPWGCGGRSARGLGSQGKTPSSGDLNGQHQPRPRVVSTCLHWPPDDLFAGKRPWETVIQTLLFSPAKMPTRGLKGRREALRCGFGLPECEAGNDLDLLPSRCAHGKQRPRETANSKSVVTRGNLATALASLGKSCCSLRGGGCLFCFDF